jgi:protein NirF
VTPATPRTLYRYPAIVLFLMLTAALSSAIADCQVRGTGDLGIVIERASGSVQVVDTTARRSLFHIAGLGGLLP